MLFRSCIGFWRVFKCEAAVQLFHYGLSAWLGVDVFTFCFCDVSMVRGCIERDLCCSIVIVAVARAQLTSFCGVILL